MVEFCNGVRLISYAAVRSGIPALLVMSLFLPAVSYADTIVYQRDADGTMRFIKVPTPENGTIVLKKPFAGADAPKAWRGSRFLNFFGVLNIKADREKITALTKQYGRMFGVDPKLVMAVIEVESGYNPGVVSHKGAQGLMQIMPETGQDLELEQPFDPEDNVRAGVRYLKDQLDRFGSVELALAAYNAGPAAVEKYNGIPPYEETQNYVRKVMALWEKE